MPRGFHAKLADSTAPLLAIQMCVHFNAMRFEWHTLRRRRRQPSIDDGFCGCSQTPPHRVNNLIEALCSALSLTMLCKSFHQVPSSPRHHDHEPRLLARIWQLAVAPLASRSRKHIATINHAKYVHRPDASVRACVRASIPLFLLFIQI